MSKKRIVGELFHKHSDDEHVEFERIPEAERRHPRPDLCGLLYLHEKLGGTGDAIEAAEHDMVYLDFDGVDNLAEADVIYLLRCGILWDNRNESLYMFV